jgi:hypothetical protein
VWSAEKRAEGLKYMQLNPSSHSGRVVGNPELRACNSIGEKSRLHSSTGSPEVCAGLSAFVCIWKT